MNKASKLILLFGVLLAVGGGGALFMYLQSLSQTEASAAQPQNIVVAATNIAPYQPVKTEQLKVKSVAAASVPPGAATDMALVVGKALNVAAVAEQPILAGSITEASLASRIPKAKDGQPLRALAITVGRLSVLNGQLKEGDSVDVMVTMKYPQVNTTKGTDGKYGDPKPEGFTNKTIAQNVQVIDVMSPAESEAQGAAVGSTVDAPAGAAPAGGEAGAQTPAEAPAPAAGAATGQWTVILAVTNQEAERIYFGYTLGVPNLVARGTNDKSIAETTGANEDILNKEAGVPLPVQVQK